MPTSARPPDRRSEFAGVYAAIEAEAQRGNWNAVSERLKDWGADTHATLPDAADRQRLAELGIALLTEGDTGDCRGLAVAFRPAGEAAIAALHDLLIDPEGEFEARWFAGQILAKLRHIEAMTALVAALDSDDEMTASIAVDTLGHFGKAEIELLVGELERTSRTPDRAKLRHSLVRALTQISDPVAIAPLLPVARDPDPAIRLLAVGAMSAFDDERVVSVLLAALHDTSPPVRKVALSGLGAKAQYSQQFRAGTGGDAPQTQPATAAPIDWLAHFQPLTLDINPEVATQATIAIGRLSSPEAISVLLKLLRSPLTPEPQALAIVRALLQIADPESISALLETCTLAPERYAVTLEAVRGIGRLRDRGPDVAARLAGWCEIRFGHLNSSEAIDSQLAHCDPTLLQAIAYGFGTLGMPVARPWLVQLAADSRDRVRIAATNALSKLATA